MRPAVSIIVPVYNVDKYLRQCLDSILAQTLKDIEIICVDDGATDRCPEILDYYADMDGRIRVFHRNNGGYGSAVNFGIDCAKGEYIGIVESDDSILGNMYQRLYALACEHDLDMVKGECYFCWDSMGYRIPHHAYGVDGYFGIVLKENDRDKFFRFFMNTWSGIYRKTFLDKFHIRHHESPGASFQDNGFWIQTMYYASRAMWIDEPLYLYRQDNEGSSIRGKYKEYAMLEEYRWVRKKLAENGLSGSDLEYCNYYQLFRHAGNLLRISDETKMDYLEVISKDYEEYGYLLEKMADGSAVDWFRRFSAAPEVFCENIIHMRNRILSRLNQADHIWICGMEDRAQRTMRILHSVGIVSKLAGFIVTKGEVKSSMIGIFPVRNIYDPQIHTENCEFIIGAKRHSRSHREIEEELYKKGIHSFLECEDMFDNFYWII
ncbi:MAG: glycosyltransferase [Lachnospiraceae bacterium]|nr:glycosyltransferase [Lachnospiraceae bacterium]